jgi:outer membrane protein assembly factor BamA
MDGARIIGFRYTVEGVRIPVRTVDFPGAAPEMIAILKEVAAPKIGSDFSETGLLTFSRLDLLPQYMSRGYLQAQFGALEFTPADVATNSVAVRLPVREGLCYRLKEVQWSGNNAFPGQELAKFLKGKSGTTANSVQLDEALGAISKNYGTRGYMRARLKANPAFNDEEKTVSFRIDVTEGDQYHMGVMRMEGASEAVKKKGGELWKLRAGDVYDSSYAQQFLKDLFQEFDLRAFRISIGESLKQESKTVDVLLRFIGH